MTEAGKREDNIPPPPPSPNPSQAECLAFVKFARYTALLADRLAGSVLQMTSRLEDAGILKPTRQSRLERDKKLRTYGVQVQKTDDEIAEMMKLIPNHPDSEKLISTLFKGMRNLNIHPPNIGADDVNGNVQIDPVDNNILNPTAEELNFINTINNAVQITAQTDQENDQIIPQQQQISPIQQVQQIVQQQLMPQQQIPQQVVNNEQEVTAETHAVIMMQDTEPIVMENESTGAAAVDVQQTEQQGEMLNQ